MRKEIIKTVMGLVVAGVVSMSCVETSSVVNQVIESGEQISVEEPECILDPQI